MGLEGDRAGRAQIAVCALICLVALATTASTAESRAHERGGSAVGKLVQLGGSDGCVVDQSEARRNCTSARALRGPAPFLGSNGIAISPDGKNVYVAASESNAIAILRRGKGGRLSQRGGPAGCISAKGGKCASGIGLVHPNSVAVSPDGQNVYATSDGSSAVTTFSRDSATGALSQATDGTGCVANAATTGCVTGRALSGADVVVVSPDGANVYVGAFFGNAIAVFNRDPATGALTQPSDSSGCLVATATSGCTSVLALAAPEGMGISGDGANVYVAAAVSNAVLVLTRDPTTGALTQATDGTGCIVDAALADCTTGLWIAGANAVSITPADESVYITSLLSNSVTSFTRTADGGQLTQQTGTSACAIYVLAVGCSLARALKSPEAIATSPDGASVYAGAFGSNAVDVFNRDPNTGALIQKSGRAGCVTAKKLPDCKRGRALQQASGLAVSPNSKQVYVAASGSDAVAVFKRIPAVR